MSMIKFKDMAEASKGIRRLERNTIGSKKTDELADAFKRVDDNAKEVTDEVTKQPMLFKGRMNEWKHFEQVARNYWINYYKMEMPLRNL